MDIGEFLQGELKAAGIDSKANAEEIRQYVRDRAAHLQTLTADPEFRVAAEAEARNVVAFAAEKAVDIADGADARAVNVAFGVLGALVSLA